MSPKTLPRILLAATLAAAAPAQEQPPAGGEAAEEAEAESPTPEEAEAERLRQLVEPGEHHAHLDRLAGEWELTLRLWPTPDGEPVESSGTAEGRWILGGRFLWTIYRAELFGEPFEAWAVEGYDNQAEEYVGTWRDSQGTYTLIYRGKCRASRPPDPDAEEPAEPPDPEELVEGSFRTMQSKLTDPVSGEVFSVKNEITLEDDGSFLLESFVVLSPEESLKNLEITGRRPAGSG